MKDSEIKAFWRDKEAELNGTLVMASYARYLDGYTTFPEAADGLLYFMNNGLYFENFPKDHWIDKMLRRKEHYTEVNIRLRNEQIDDISCYQGQEDKFSVPFRKRLAALFGLLPRLLLVAFHEGEEKGLIRFACTESPFSLCAAFYGRKE